jgi:phage baseplate assembly protein W
MLEEKAISLPFTITPQGTVQITTDQRKIWQDRVFSVISTGIGERVNRHMYGSRIFTQDFNGASAAAESIKKEVADIFQALLPLLTLVETITSFSADQNTLSVEVRYKLPNEELQTTSLGTVSLRGNNPPKDR